MEGSYSKEIEVTRPIYSAIDSCPDTVGYDCNNPNLVCNGSFEWNADTVSGGESIALAAPWRDLLTHCDLFNSTNNAPGFSGVPNNIFGYQQAKDGDAYMGLFVLIDSFNSESVTAPLKDTLIESQPYQVDMWFNKSNYTPWSLSGMQIGFSSEELNPGSYSDLVNLVDTSYILNPLGDSIISDTSIWTHFRDTIVADTSNLSWIMIGYMIDSSEILKSFDNSISNPYYPGFFENQAYYFVDSVSVTPLPPIAYLPDTVWICQGDTVTLKLSGIGTNNYYWSTGAFVDSIVVSPTSPTNYSVSISSLSLCDSVILTTHVGFYNYTSQVTASIQGYNNDCDSIAKYWPIVDDDDYTYEWKIPDTSGMFVTNQSHILTRSDAGTVRVHWTNIPASPAYSVITLIILNDCNDTIAVDTLKVFECCTRTGSMTLANDTLNAPFIYTDQLVYINGNVVVLDSAFYLASNPGGSRNKLIFGPEASMTLLGGATLTLVETDVWAGCEHMWNNIHAPTAETPGIQLINSTVKDGITAIKIDSAVPLMIDSTQFINNYIGVMYQNGDFNVKDNSFHQMGWPIQGDGYHVQIEQSAFYQEGFPSQGLQLDPLKDSLAHSGIYIDSVSTMMIGHASFDTNHFSRMMYGIYSTNSEVQVYNTNFRDFYHTSANLIPAHSAIYSFRGLSSAQEAGIVIGKDSANYSNSFETCLLAVNNMNQSLHATNNNFLNCKVGIKSINPVDSVIITKNNFNQQPISQLNPPLKTAIQVQAVNPLRAADVIIDTNKIRGYQKGIWATSLSGSAGKVLRIAADTILFEVDMSSASGIKIENSTAAYVGNNVIGGYQVPTSVDTGKYNGIWVSATSASAVKHNKMLRVGHGIYTTGSSLLTEFICNDLDSCYHGFYFGPYTALSDQGNIEENPNNRYMGDYSLGGYSYYRRMGGIDTNITNPIIDWYYEDQFSEFDPGIISTGSNHPLRFHIDDIENLMANNECDYDTTVYDPFNIDSPGEREALFGEIIEEQTLYSTNIAYNTDHEDELFLTSAARNPELLVLNDTSDQMYQNYFDSLANGTHGERYNILSLMAMGYFDLARQENANFKPIDIWEQKRKKVNAIYLDTWAKNNYRFSENEEDSLRGIALSSPYIHGDAVYSARVMLNIDPDDYHLTYRTPITEKVVDKEIELVIYPNPAREKYCIKLQSSTLFDEEVCTYSMYDISGRLIASKSVRMNLSFEHCEEIGSLGPGVYIIEARTKNSGLLDRGKFVVQ